MKRRYQVIVNESGKKMLDLDFVLATQNNPAIVAQMIVWDMTRRTADWPPESMTQAVDIANKMNHCLSKVTPYVAELEFVPDGEEETDL